MGQRRESAAISDLEEREMRTPLDGGALSWRLDRVALPRWAGSRMTAELPLGPATREVALVAISLIPLLMFALSQMAANRPLALLSYAVVAVAGVAAPWFGFLALVPMLPFNHTGVFGLGPIVVLLTVIGLSAALHLPRRPADGAFAGNLRPLGLGLGFCVLTAIQLAAAGSMIGMPLPTFAVANFGQVAASILLYVVGVVVLRGRSIWPYVASFAGSAGFIAIVAILTFVRPTALQRPIFAWAVSPDATLYRATGVIGNPNYLGLYVALAACFLGAFAVWAWSAGTRGRAVWALLPAAGAGMALLVSFSRAAMLAIFVGVLLMTFRRSVRWGIALAVVGVVLAIVAYPIFLDLRLDQTFSGGSGAQQSAQNASDGLRLTMAKAAIAAFADAPLFGHGFSTFQVISPGYSGQHALLGAHNMYLNLAAEQGLAGLLVFAALVVVVLGPLLRARSGIPLAALGAFAAFLVFGVTGDVLATVQAAGPAWLFAAFGRTMLGDRPSEGPETRHPWRLTIRLDRP